MSLMLVADELVEMQDRRVMRSSTSRRKFAIAICEALQFWSVEEMIFFVDEMRGLNFGVAADRKLFVDFLQKWIPMEDAR